METPIPSGLTEEVSLLDAAIKEHEAKATALWENREYEQSMKEVDAASRARVERAFALDAQGRTTGALDA